MLNQFEPVSVWNYFERLCAIPRPSGRESAAAEFVSACASELGLSPVTDATGNILVRKKATDSTKTHPVVLQSHLDMVPQKNAGTIHDFSKDPIRPIVEGEWVKADGTTLGADNGIGVALALAVLADTAISHGPIEALFTVDEERGMTGAFGLDHTSLTGKKLINLDTENEGEICIGCAGGTDVIATFPTATEAVPAGHCARAISLKGLLGGHSGMEIHLDRANAIRLMGALLAEASRRFDATVSDFHGGSARNAIPREAFAVITLPPANETAFNAFIAETTGALKKTFATTDPGLTISVAKTGIPDTVIETACRNAFLSALSAIPNGIIRMSDTLPGAVETSSNCAIVKCSGNLMRIDCMLRSSVDEKLLEQKELFTTIFKRYHAAVNYGSIYPAWQPDSTSPLLAVMKNAYRSVHLQEPAVVVVHAGLECGIIGNKFPGMEMISCGPSIEFAHSPDERMHIPSVERFWKCLVNGLAMLS